MGSELAARVRVRLILRLRCGDGGALLPLPGQCGARLAISLARDRRRWGSGLSAKRLHRLGLGSGLGLGLGSGSGLCKERL